MSEQDPAHTPVHEAKILVTVYGDEENAQDLNTYLSSLSLEDLGRAMDQGDLIGESSMVSFRQVPEGEVVHRLREIGNDGTFFDLEDESRPDAGRPQHAETRVEKTISEAGWTQSTALEVAVEYLREIEMADDFAAWIEEKAAAEHDAGMEIFGPN